MEKIIVLGTGYATAENLFNTCFVLENDKKEKLLVDTGGGNGILSRLTKANVPINEIHDIFISHKHSDHVLGILWIIRKLEKFIADNKYEGNLTIYCHSELEKVIRGLCELTFKKRFLDLFDTRIFFKILEDGQKVNVIGYELEAIDICAKSDLQYGFKTKLDNGKTFIFLGDEPLREPVYDRVKNVDYMCHEAFCLDSEAHIHTPYKFNHDTAKSAAEKAEMLNVKTLILWHTREDFLDKRAERFKEEASKYFKGNIIVPEDLDIIEL